MSSAENVTKTSDKQQAILGFAMEVFAKEGFRNTDVQVIADLAGVGKGTVYRYFGNKEQLFLATAKYCLDQFGEYAETHVGREEDLARLVEEHGVVALFRTIARVCAEFYVNHPQAVEIMIQERAEFRESVFPTHLLFRAERRSGIERLFRLAIERGEFRQLDVIEASNTFADLFWGSVVNGCLEGGRNRLVQRVENATEMLLQGFVQTNSTANHPTADKPSAATN